jgi:hypothetical protein
MKHRLKKRYGRGLADRRGPHAPTYRVMIDHDGFYYLWHNGAWRSLGGRVMTNDLVRRNVAAVTGEKDRHDFHLSFERKR